MKTLTIQAQKESLELLGTLFKKSNGASNPTGGSNYIVDSFRGLYRQTLIKMQGTFTTQDIYLMISVTNGLILTPQIAGQHILANVEDGITLDRLELQYKTDGPALLEKLKSLSIPERAFLEIWLKGFWEQHGTLGALSLEDYIEPLLASAPWRISCGK